MENCFLFSLSIYYLFWLFIDDYVYRLYFNNSFIKIYSITLISYAIFNVQSLSQWLNTEDKITEDYLLIQDSINNRMIDKCYWYQCPRPGNVGVSMTSFRLCNQRLLRSLRLRFIRNGGDSKTTLQQPACICLRKHNPLLSLRSVYRKIP